ncbi:MAG: glycosyltransferase, partial [Planctomycetaceae bacterium]|nr:glycosyltransferase [Planctomycetaceae bacterium]
GDRCLFVGNIDPVTPFFKAIDISINTAEMEILSMSLCEAQACGKPTLAYAVGGNPEALPDAWCTVPFGDIGELEGKAAALVADVERRRTLGHQAYQHIRRHFDAPVLAERQAAIYREVMRKRLNGATP